MKQKFIRLTNSSGKERTVSVDDIAFVYAVGNGIKLEYFSGTSTEFAESYSYVKKLIIRTMPRRFLEFVATGGTYLINAKHVSHLSAIDDDTVTKITFVDNGTLTASTEKLSYSKSRFLKHKRTGFITFVTATKNFLLNVENIVSVYGNGGSPEKAKIVLSNSATPLTAATEKLSYFLKRAAAKGNRNFNIAEDISGFGDGDVTFTVTDPVNSDAPVENATINFIGTSKTTDGYGVAVFDFNNVNLGSQSYTIEKDNWETYSGTITVTDGMSASEDVDLVGLSDVTVTAEDGDGTAVEGATVTITADGETYSGTTLANGNVTLEDVHFDATATIAITSATGYVDNTGNSIDIDSHTETETITMVSKQTDFETFDIYDTTTGSGGVSIATGAAIIDETAHTIAIEVESGTDLSAGVVPIFTLDYGATVDTISNDTSYSGFTDGVATTVTVTAEDSSTTQDWDITVTVAS